MKKIDVDYVARLARLKLSEEEKNKFSEQLTKILEYMNKLNELDTTNVKPISHIVELKNVYRQDTVKPSELAKDIISNAPQKDGSYFKVKKVIE